MKNALEPEWEARFEGRSYGFRPGRSCHDAVAVIYQAVSGRDKKRLWVLDADLKGAFDRISHAHLMEAIGAFPARKAIYQWLRAGVMEDGKFAPTVEGTPQGGVISPLLLNVALHGMGESIGCVEKGTSGQKSGKPMLIRYADDFVVLCTTQEEARGYKDQLASWLEPRGLTFNEEKTRVVHLEEGFDFLGFNVRRYRGHKTLIKPSRDAVRRARAKMSQEVKAMGALTTVAVIGRLNPMVKGWATYYRGSVAVDSYRDLDFHLFRRMWRWAKRRHPKKSAGWIKQKYFGSFNPGRHDTWVFGDKESNRYLHKFSWTNIVRHVLVTGTSSPDDPDLAQYWAKRRRKRVHPQADGKLNVSLAARQKGLCPLCGQDLIEGAGYEPESVREWAEWFLAHARTINRHHLVYRALGGPDDKTNLALIHAECHRQHHALDAKRGPKVLSI